MKNYRVANVKPDEEYKVDFRIAGEKDAIRSMVKKYRKRVRQYFKKEITKSTAEKFNEIL